MISIPLFKVINREPFQVCWYRFPLFRGSIYKGKFAGLGSYLLLVNENLFTLGGVSGVILGQARDCSEGIMKQ